MTAADRRRALQWIATAALLPGCAVLGDPVQVAVVGLEALPGEGLELRFLCKLRVQNPNDTPIEYDGVYVEIEVHGNTLASGVSDASGSVPRFGEAVLSVPVTVSAVRLARQLFSLYGAGDHGTIAYVLRGKISGPAFSAARFESRGELRPGADRAPRVESPP